MVPAAEEPVDQVQGVDLQQGDRVHLHLTARRRDRRARSDGWWVFSLKATTSRRCTLNTSLKDGAAGDAPLPSHTLQGAQLLKNGTTTSSPCKSSALSELCRAFCGLKQDHRVAVLSEAGGVEGCDLIEMGYPTRIEAAGIGS